jgi:hypothetical protein
MRETLTQRIKLMRQPDSYVLVCGPLPCRHQLERGALPPCAHTVCCEALQLQQRVVGCLFLLSPDSGSVKVPRISL